MPSDGRLHEPWASFLRELDAQLTQRTELHCLGGFVASELYGLERPTADIDILESTGSLRFPRELHEPGGIGSLSS